MKKISITYYQGSTRAYRKYASENIRHFRIWIEIMPVFYGWNFPKNVDYSFKNILLMVAFFALAWLFSYGVLTHVDFRPTDITYTDGRGRAFLSMLSQHRFGLVFIGALIAIICTFVFTLTLGLITNLVVRIRLFIFPIR